MDLISGYYQFRLHPDTRKYFTVKMVMADDVERFFNILSYLWVEPLRVLVLPPCLMLLDDGEEGSWMMVKKTLGYRVDSKVEDFTIAPSLGRASTAADCRKASRRFEELLRRYGLTRHHLKGVCGAGSQCLQHPGS
jgi:hypothetical protein